MEIPIPTTFEAVVWLGIGLTWGAAWGISDYSIIHTKTIKKANIIVQKLIGFLLDGLHHWWMGALLVQYSEQLTTYIGLPSLAVPVKWFGCGLMSHDAKDIPRRIRKHLNFFNNLDKKT